MCCFLRFSSLVHWSLNQSFFHFPLFWLFLYVDFKVSRSDSKIISKLKIFQTTTIWPCWFRGDRKQHCFRPLLTLNQWLYSPFCITAHRKSLYRSCMRFIIFSGIPLCPRSFFHFRKCLLYIVYWIVSINCTFYLLVCKILSFLPN